MRSTQVAILGSGPAGMLAALAVEQAGHEPVIYAQGDKSPMFGAMYLHEAIPGVCDPVEPDFDINVMKVGTYDGYAYNVYGNRFANCSWSYIEEGPTPAWDLKATYDLLWDRYQPAIRKYNLGPSDLGSICNNYLRVYSSVPAPVFCRQAHTFESKDIWVIHGSHINPIPGVNDGDLMYYNGIPSDGSFAAVADDYPHDDGLGRETFTRGHEWYRFSQINGYQAWEYSRKPLIESDNPRTLSTGTKPLGHNCDCFSCWSSFIRIGRFGRWEKGVLTHHAYRQVSEDIRNAL